MCSKWDFDILSSGFGILIYDVEVINFLLKILYLDYFVKSLYEFLF